ncbi:MAG: ATP-binding protein [Thermoanaerobaculia bacterium]
MLPAEDPGGAQPPFRILVVDDSPADRRLARELLAESGSGPWILTMAEDLTRGVALASSEPFDAVLLDLGLPEAAGLETFRRMHAAAGLVPIVVLTGLGDRALALECVKQGAEEYLVKGQAGPEALARTLRYAVERARHRRRLLAAEARTRLLLENAKEAEARIRHLNRLLRTISEVNELIVMERDVARILSEVCRILVEKGEFAGARVYLVDEPGAVWRLAAAAGRPCPGAGLEPGPPSAEAGEALLRGERRVASCGSCPGSCLYFPLAVAGVSSGALAILRETREELADDVRELLDELARDVGFAIEVSRREEARRRAEEEVRRLNVDLEERVARRTAELETKTKEIESFSYSVSHDLRAPLRAIDGFSAELESALAGRLDDEERRLLSTVRASAKRMGRLIDDLLSFARTGRHAMNAAPVEVEPLVRSVLGELAVPEGSLRAEVRIGPLPDAFADPALLRQVWVNLLSNAVKFSAPREKPVIEIRGRVADGTAVFEVEDNGVGFDARYADQLFGVFKRLHGRDFDGTGIGLALVHSIVTRHGGTIRASSGPDGGATFAFTLPPGPGRE